MRNTAKHRMTILLVLASLMITGCSTLKINNPQSEALLISVKNPKTEQPRNYLIAGHEEVSLFHLRSRRYAIRLVTHHEKLISKLRRQRKETSDFINEFGGVMPESQRTELRAELKTLDAELELLINPEPACTVNIARFETVVMSLVYDDELGELRCDL